MDGCRISALFHDLSTTRARPYLQIYRYPWEILDALGAAVFAIGTTLSESEFETRGEGIWVSRRATIADDAHLQAPCIIEDGAELRHGAFLRGGTLVGRGAVVGNSCELKTVFCLTACRCRISITSATRCWVGASISARERSPPISRGIVPR